MYWTGHRFFLLPKKINKSQIVSKIWEKIEQCSMNNNQSTMNIFITDTFSPWELEFKRRQNIINLHDECMWAMDDSHAHSGWKRRIIVKNQQQGEAELAKPMCRGKSSCFNYWRAWGPRGGESGGEDVCFIELVITEDRRGHTWPSLCFRFPCHSGITTLSLLWSFPSNTPPGPTLY